MPKKTIQFIPVRPSTAHGRTFEINIFSDSNGYSAEVAELLDGGVRVPINLPYGPRVDLSPQSFFKMREHHRGCFVSDLKSEIRCGTVVRLSGSTIPPIYFIRANLTGWPQGYPGALEDDMEAWISESLEARKLSDAGFMDLVCTIQQYLRTPDGLKALAAMPEAQRDAAFRLGDAAKGYVEAVGGRMAAAPQVASTDEATGMAWWNGLDDAQRKDWMARAGNTGVVADAWAAFKRHSLN